MAELFRIKWAKQARILRLTRHDNAKARNSYSKKDHNLYWKTQLDFENPVQEGIGLEFFETALRETENKSQFEEWLAEKYSMLSNGVYFFIVPAVYAYATLQKKKKFVEGEHKKSGRKRYSYGNYKKKRKKGHPYRRRKGGLCCICRFEVSEGIFRVSERMSRRKYYPFNKPHYPIINWLNHVKEKRLSGLSNYTEVSS